MQKLSLFILVLTLLCGAANAQNKLTHAEIQQGWELLFDGTTTNGWRGYNKPTFPETGWEVINGTLHLKETVDKANRVGDIIFGTQFQNFELSIDWKIAEGGNSGIFFLGQELENEPLFKSAPEMQVLDNERHPDATKGTEGNHRAGSLYDMLPADPKFVNPAGQWNTAVIKLNNGACEFFMNGQKVVEFTLWTAQWDTMVANSKFITMPAFAKAKQGYIGLQDHFNEVWFRNIKLRKL
jgi:hypothetical protein